MVALSFLFMLLKKIDYFMKIFKILKSLHNLTIFFFIKKNVWGSLIFFFLFLSQVDYSYTPNQAC